jgi:hypothetical protein
MNYPTNRPPGKRNSGLNANPKPQKTTASFAMFFDHYCGSAGGRLRRASGDRKCCLRRRILLLLTVVRHQEPGLPGFMRSAEHEGGAYTQFRLRRLWLCAAVLVNAALL